MLLHAVELLVFVRGITFTFSSADNLLVLYFISVRSKFEYAVDRLNFRILCTTRHHLDELFLVTVYIGYKS
jgi:hypothetical protein